MSFDVFELNKKGVDAAMRGSMQKAEELFREATSLDNEFSEAAFNLIKLLHMQHRYHEAIQTFNHIIRTKALRQFPFAISNIIGDCASNISDISAACDCFEVLHKHCPNHTEIACRFSSILISSGQLVKAKSMLERSCLLNANDPSLLTQLAITESELGNYQRAEVIHKNLIKIYGHHFLSNYNYALFLSMLGRDEESVQLLNKCLSIVPNAPEAVSEIERINQKSSSILSNLYHNVESCSWQNVTKLLFEFKHIIEPIYYWSVISDLPLDIASTIEDINTLMPLPHFEKCDLYASVTERNKYLPEIERYIKNQESLICDRAGKPTRFGMQSHELLLGTNDEIIIDLTNRLSPLISKFVESKPLLIEMCNTKNFQNKLSGWGVLLSKGGYQKRHIHPEAIVSGVIYIKLSDECLDETLNGGNLLLHSYHNDVIITPEEGRVVLFPSHLGHETIPLTTSSERICIAFNYS